MTGPDRIYLDADADAEDGYFPRCFANPKYCSEPAIEYIRRDPAVLAALRRCIRLQDTISHQGLVTRCTIKTCAGLSPPVTHVFCSPKPTSETNRQNRSS